MNKKTKLFLSIYIPIQSFFTINMILSLITDCSPLGELIQLLVKDWCLQ